MAERDRMPTSAMSELLADRVDQLARRRVRFRRMLTAGLIGFGILFGILSTLVKQTPYASMGRLQMFLRASPTTRMGRLGKQGLANQRELMMGTTFLGDVVARLSPEDRAKLLGKEVKPGKHSAAQQAAQVQDAMGGFDVEVEPSTLMLELTFTSGDPQLSADVVSAAMLVAGDLGLRLQQERAARMSNALSGRLDDLARKIKAAEDAQDAEQARFGRALVSGTGRPASAAAVATAPNAVILDRRAMKLARRKGRTSNKNVARLATEEPEADELLVVLTQALNTATLQRKLTETQANILATLHAQGADEVVESQFKGVTGNAVQELRQVALEQRLRANVLAVQLGPAQPELRSAQAAADAAEREIAAADERLVVTAQAAAGVARQREAELKAAVEARKQIASAQVLAQMQDQLPQLDLAVDEDLLEAQTEVLRSAQVNEGLKAFGFDVVDRPEVPLHRLPRDYKSPILLDASAGALLGLLASLLLYGGELFRWDLADASRRSGLGLVAVLPQIRGGTRLRGSRKQVPVVLSTPNGVYADALDELAGKVMEADRASKVPVVIVTSATPGEGKSTTAANLAILLARRGERVLLVDADLHRPAIHQAFGLSGSGLGHVLAGRAELRETVQHVAAVDGLDVLIAGPVPPQASALIQSGRLEEMLAIARTGGYSAILLDAPPILGSSDSAYLARWADVLLFVARWGQVDLRRVQRAARVLEATAPAISGLVVNSVPVE